VPFVVALAMCIILSLLSLISFKTHSLNQQNDAFYSADAGDYGKITRASVSGLLKKIYDVLDIVFLNSPISSSYSFN